MSDTDRRTVLATLVGSAVPRADDARPEDPGCGEETYVLRAVFLVPDGTRRSYRRVFTDPAQARDVARQAVRDGLEVSENDVVTFYPASRILVITVAPPHCF